MFRSLTRRPSAEYVHWVNIRQPNSSPAGFLTSVATQVVPLLYHASRKQSLLALCVAIIGDSA